LKSSETDCNFVDPDIFSDNQDEANVKESTNALIHLNPDFGG
jgi:hypothetical protein